MEDEIEVLARELSVWRETKKTRYERIPLDLRERAMAMVEKYPRSVITKKLGLAKNFFPMKKTKSDPPLPGQFVRVVADKNTESKKIEKVQCELELASGLKLRIY